MRRIPWYIVLIVIFLGLYSYALYKKPVKTNWTPTLMNKDKIPYGTYVLFHELGKIFNQEPIESRITPYEQCGDSSYVDEAYILVNTAMDLSEADINELLPYVARGNHVFISTEDLPAKFSDTLGFSLDRGMSEMITNDSITTRLVNPVLDAQQYYSMPRNTINTYFSKFDTSKTVILGMNNKNKVNFIRIPWGKGQFYINTVPAMFTNYSLLDEKNYGYVSKALSYLPGDPDGLYWDEYFKQGRVGKDSPLRVVLENPGLKAAFFTALLAIIAYMIFQSKRRQRIIPVISPPENSTVDFVETVSQVYFNSSNHRNIAMKQITYLFEYIRSAYHLDTSMPDDAFAKRLAHKTGFPETESVGMMKLIRYVRSEEKISDQHLLKLNHYIQEFHKYSSR